MKRFDYKILAVLTAVHLFFMGLLNKEQSENGLKQSNDINEAFMKA